MKKILAIMSIAGVAALSTTAATAQVTKQQAVLGASSDPVYSVRVEGANGVIYKCKPELTTTADGTPARVCVREKGDGGTVFDSGTGIGNAAPAAAAVLVAVAIIASDDDNDDASGTANGTGN